MAGSIILLHDAAQNSSDDRWMVDLPPHFIFFVSSTWSRVVSDPSDVRVNFLRCRPPGIMVSNRCVLVHNVLGQRWQTGEGRGGREGGRERKVEVEAGESLSIELDHRRRRARACANVDAPSWTFGRSTDVTRGGGAAAVRAVPMPAAEDRRATAATARRALGGLSHAMVLKAAAATMRRRRRQVSGCTYGGGL